MAAYPCRYYGCHPNDSEEILYGLRLSKPVSEEGWRALLADLIGIPGAVLPPPTDPDGWWFEAADEAIGRIDIGVGGDWAIVYQNVGFPGVDGTDPERFEMSGYEKAFRAHAEALGLIEIVALFGTAFDYEPDPWTEWSLEQGRPSRVVIGDRPWSSPWDEHDD